MASVVKMVDEYFGSTPPGRKSGGELHLVSERVTPREIIRRRAEGEVEAINREREKIASRLRACHSFIIAPDTSEMQLNGKDGAKRRVAAPLDAVRETERALAAFERRGFIMLVDGRQIDDVDAAITLRPESEVVFLYLTPLKGG